MTAEQNVSGLATLGFIAFAFYRVYSLLFKENPSKSILDPWGQEVEESMQQDNAAPVCHKCFTPQHSSDRFCENCGMSVGPYNNWMPYLHVFSEGEVLRNGTSGKFQINAVTIAGYILYSITVFFVFAPVYWFFLFKNVGRIRSLSGEENISNEASATYDSRQSE